MARYVGEKRKKERKKRGEAGIVNECGSHNEKGGGEDLNPVSFVSLHSSRFNLEICNAAKGL